MKPFRVHAEARRAAVNEFRRTGRFPADPKLRRLCEYLHRAEIEFDELHRLFAEPNDLEKETVLRHSIAENLDRDGLVRIYDLRAKQFRVVAPDEAVVLCLGGGGSVARPLR
jgi:hypothetical protein